MICYACGDWNYNEIVAGFDKCELISFRHFKCVIDRNSVLSESRSKAGSSKKQYAGADWNKPEQTGTNAAKEEEKEKKQYKNDQEEQENKKEEKRRGERERVRRKPPTFKDVWHFCNDQQIRVDVTDLYRYLSSVRWTFRRMTGRPWLCCMPIASRRERIRRK